MSTGMEDLDFAEDISKMLEALREQPERRRTSVRKVQDRAPGSALGPYRILSTLGRGAYGVVYRASDGSRELALKVLRRDLLSGDRAVTVQARFEREGRLSAQIEHPQLVKTYGFGEHEGTLYMACELVPGGSLAELLAEGTLTEQRALILTAQILKALVALEENALVHRDVKPANILLDERGRAKLSDLGLVRSTSPGYTLLTETGLTVGTPSYMAPEQIMGSPDLDIRCDLYALGATLFHMLAGQPPFVCSTSYEVVQAHLNRPPTDVRLFAPALGDETAALVDRLLNKIRDRRPSTAREALRQVEKALELAQDPSEVFLPTALPGDETVTLEADPPEGSATAELLVPEDASSQSAASKVALRVRGPAGEARLFVFAGRSLVLGRGVWAGLRLRHRSAIEPRRLDERISPRHARLRIVGDKAELIDLVSSYGTTLDQRRVAPGQAAEIGDWATLILGGALQINALKVADLAEKPICIKDAGLVARGAPALYLSRPFDGPEHTYALIPGRLRLSISAAGEIAPDKDGRVEVLNVNGVLWARDREASPQRCRRLAPGTTWVIGADTLAVDALVQEPEEA